MISEGQLKHSRRGFPNGIIIDRIECQSIIEKREKERKLTSDSENRKYITELILKNIKDGKTQEDALDIALSDEVAKSFDYLEKNGLNKRECFKNWVKNYEKNKKLRQERGYR